MIGFDEKQTDRTPASALPAFDNDSTCDACGNGRLIRIHYDPGCREVAGPHFHRLCPCGARWAEA